MKLTNNMTYWEMLCELKEAIDEGVIFNDRCEHEEPQDTDEFCTCCFILNLWANASETDEEFEVETTELQRDTVMNLWDKYCDS